MFEGSGGGFYQWSRGVQIRANLDLLMDWTQSIGLGDLAADSFQKLSSAVNLLATPKETLLQVRNPRAAPQVLAQMLKGCFRDDPSTMLMHLHTIKCSGTI